MTHQADKVPGQSRLILSLFPGIDLLGRAFEDFGYCVVRGPDLIFGGDIRVFNPPCGVFWGVIGGPPCQDFSSLRRDPPVGHGLKMLAEFQRCVTEANPEWWLMENVARVPDVIISGYNWQRLDIDLKWFNRDCSRLRHIQFGSKSGRLINVTSQSVTNPVEHTAALANDTRSLDELKQIQGLPDDYTLPAFTVKEAKRAIGNGVPLPMGRALASAVTNVYSVTQPSQLSFDGVTWPGHSICSCGCGRPVTNRAKYAGDEKGDSSACRKRAQRRRERERVKAGFEAEL